MAIDWEIFEGDRSEECEGDTTGRDDISVKLDADSIFANNPLVSELSEDVAVMEGARVAEVQDLTKRGFKRRLLESDVMMNNNRHVTDLLNSSDDETIRFGTVDANWHTSKPGCSWRRRG